MCQQYHVTTEKMGTEYLFGKIGQGGSIQYEGEIHYQFVMNGSYHLIIIQDIQHHSQYNSGTSVLS